MNFSQAKNFLAKRLAKGDTVELPFINPSKLAKVKATVKSVIKKMYYLLAGPLYRKLVSEFDARLEQTLTLWEARGQSAKLMRADELKLKPTLELVEELRQEVNQLQKVVCKQATYLKKLNDQGLNQLMDHYHRDQLWSSATVAAALADIKAGMEFDTVGKKHRVPTEVILIWAGYCKSESTKTDPNTLDFNFDENALQLCERQLEYNSKVYREREELVRLELERLEKELADFANFGQISEFA